MSRQAKDVSEVTLRDILYVVFKHKFNILLIFLVSVLGAIGYLVYVKPTYEATTKILVQLGKEKTESLATSSANPNVVFAARPEDIRDEIEILTDKTIAYAVLPTLRKWLEDAYRPPQTLLDRIRAWVNEQLRALKELAYRPLYALGLAVKLTPEQKFVLSLQGALDAEPIEETDVIRLKFGWPNPQFAAFAANAFAEEYVRRRIGVYASGDAEKFYTDQIALYRDKLSGVEGEIERFRIQEGISNIDLQRELLLREISALEHQDSEIRGNLRDLRVKLDAIHQAYRSGDGWLETPLIGEAIPDMTALDRKFFDTLAERNRLLETDTPRSRAVQSVTSQLEKLRASKLHSLESFIEPQIRSELDRQQLVKGRLAEQRAALNALDQKGRTLRELERQRDLYEQSYTEYSRKAEDFRISEALNKRRITSVKILGPALAPVKPSKPWTTVIVALAAFLGLFLGFAYATISEYFDHTFGSKEDVESELGLPVLATVPDMRYRRRMAAWPWASGTG